MFNFKKRGQQDHAQKRNAKVENSRSEAQTKNLALNTQKSIDLALQHHTSGDLVQAQKIYEDILAREPNHPVVLHFLGVIAHQLGKNDKAVDLILKAVSIKPDYAAAYNNLGTALQELNESDEAVKYYLQALILDPNFADALNNLGNAYEKQCKYEEAVSVYQRAIEINPNLTAAYNNLGMTLYKLGKLDEAQENYLSAIQIEPNYFEAYFNLGSTLEKLEMLDEALTNYSKALTIKPDYADSYNGIGNVYHKQNKKNKAEENFKKALTINPEHAAAHFNIAEFSFHRHDLQKGWEEYDWGLKMLSARAQFRKLLCDVWQGEPLQGKNIFVHAEQGVGDEIMFSSCISNLLEQSPNRIFLECDSRLGALFERSFGNVQVCGKERNLDNSWMGDEVTLDYSVSIGSLPKFFRNQLSDFPARKSFLIPNPKLKETFRMDYTKRWSGKFLVGVSWSSSSKAGGGSKGVSLEELRPLFANPDCQFINLQYGDVEDELLCFEESSGHHIFRDEKVDPMLDIDAFAAQVSALDLVISISNTTVHVAGALGVPTWGLLSDNANWRWSFGTGNDSAWYPALKLYRQKVLGEWGEVISHVEKDLKLHIKNNGLEKRRPPKLIKGSSRDAIFGQQSPVTQKMINHAVQCHSAGDLVKAESLYKDILQADPKHPVALHHLGVIAHQTGKIEIAVDLISKALVEKPDYPEAHNNLGTSLKELGQLDNALACYQEAIALNPDYVDGYYNIGTTLNDLGSFEEAIGYYQKALSLSPDNARVHNSLGLAFQNLHKNKEAVFQYRKAVALNPEYANAHFNLAKFSLSEGNFKQGWIEFEWGLKEKGERYHDRKLECKIWQGQPLKGKNIFVYAEQGIGDEIMFSSCISNLLEQSPNRIFLECDPRLGALFERSFDNVQVCGKERNLDTSWMGDEASLDYFISIGSLPKFFRNQLSDFPVRESFLIANSKLKETFRTDYAKRWQGKFLVGVSWNSSSKAKGESEVISLEELRPLLSNSDCQFINLQYGEVKDELLAFKEATGHNIFVDEKVDPMHDIDTLAAQVSALDLVISISNTTIHIAGALGVPTWGLLSNNANWRWFAQKDKSLWYPNTRLYKQQIPEDWDGVIKQVGTDLKQQVICI